VTEPRAECGIARGVGIRGVSRALALTARMQRQADADRRATGRLGVGPYRGALMRRIHADGW